MNYIPLPSGIYPKYGNLVQHSKVNLCHPSHQHAKEEKSYDPIKRREKPFDKF